MTRFFCEAEEGKVLTRVHRVRERDKKIVKRKSEWLVGSFGGDLDDAFAGKPAPTHEMTIRETHMAMPERLKPTPATPKIRALMKDLLKQILDRIWDNQERESPEINALIEQWNSHAGRPFEFHEFRDMHSHTSAANFLRTAFHQERYVDDLSFAEACAVADFICQCEGTESDTDYALNLLETNFPEANVSDLIFWPNEWFGDQDLLHIELSSAQIIGYLMAQSSRQLQDAPPITLPYPIPPQP